MITITLLALLQDESGTFLLYHRDAEAGAEEYALKTVDGRPVLEAKSDFKVGAMHITAEQTLTWTAEGDLHAYRALSKINETEIEVKFDVAGGEAATSVRQDKKTVDSAVALKPGTVLLDNNIFSQMIPLARAARKGEGESVEMPCFAPAALRVVPMKAVRKGAVTLRAGDKTIETDWIQLHVSSLAIDTYSDPEGRVVLIANPFQGFRASLKGFEDYKPVPRVKPIELPKNVVERDVTFKNGDLTLAGSLTRPTGSGKTPAVVLISGSGAQDRDANVAAGEFPKWNIFKQVAYALSAEGVAVLRYDDRGTAKSEGDFSVATLSDLVSDVEAAVAFLRTVDGIDPDRIGLVGHSEGAVIAPIVAAGADIRAIFLMAGTAAPLDEVVLEQSDAQAVRKGATDEERAGQREALESFFTSIRDSDATHVEFNGAPVFAVWWREHINHDPLATIVKVRGAVAIYQGMEDLQVLPRHAKLLGEALGDRKDVVVRPLKGLDHLFMKSSGDVAEYGDPERAVDAGFLKALVGDAREMLGGE